ncbi:DUF4358 domain-containing protein [Bacillus sp. 1P06AnD]|uniref:DUF4358 domain-containing protein n=1 Tax=Bacillus sp. 1P06AnD TaxID=3132208 RepID=UPI0039A0827D
MKKLHTLFIAFALLFTMAGCQSSKTDNNVSVNEIMDTVKMQMADDMRAEGDSQEYLVDGKLQGYHEIDLLSTESNDPVSTLFKQRLKINEDELEEGVVLAPLMNTKSDEIIILKAKHGNMADTLKKVLEKEKDAQIDTWSQYLPDQYEKVKNNRIEVKGKYLIYVTYEKPDEIIQTFNKELKGK